MDINDEVIFNGMVQYNRKNGFLIKSEFQYYWFTSNIDYAKSTMKLDEIFQECIERKFTPYTYYLHPDSICIRVFDNMNNILGINVPFISLKELFNTVINYGLGEKIVDCGRTILEELAIMKRIYDGFSLFTDDEKLHLELLSNEHGDD